jgi:hypothetical protein
MLADSAQEVGGKLYILGGPLPLRPGTRYVWELSIDGLLDEDWNRQFLAREP